MPELKNKVLEEHIQRMILEKSTCGFSLISRGRLNPVDCISCFWESLISNKDIDVKNIIGLNGHYGLQLYSDKGHAYIKEQLKELGEQSNA